MSDKENKRIYMTENDVQWLKDEVKRIVDAVEGMRQDMSNIKSTYMTRDAIHAEFDKAHLRINNTEHEFKEKLKGKLDKDDFRPFKNVFWSVVTILVGALVIAAFNEFVL